MTNTLSRADELRNDLENMHFTCKNFVRRLAELEGLGETQTIEFKTTEANLQILRQNIKRLEEALEAEEKREFEEVVDPYYFSDGMHW